MTIACRARGDSRCCSRSLGADSFDCLGSQFFSRRLRYYATLMGCDRLWLRWLHGHPVGNLLLIVQEIPEAFPCQWANGSMGFNAMPIQSKK